MFRDENTGNLIYITETGFDCGGAWALGGPGEVAAAGVEDAMELRARKAGEKEFTGTTKGYGIEVFRDKNNGNLVYITDVGTVAVLTARPPG